MPNRAIYLVVVEGFADWEPAHAVAELRRHGGYRVETVGLNRDPVISMGGLRITPSRTIDELDINDVAAFICPAAIAGKICRSRPSLNQRSNSWMRARFQSRPSARRP